MRTWFYCGLMLLMTAGCTSRKAYLETVQQYPESQPVREEMAEEKVTVKQEEVKLIHGKSLLRYCIILGSFSREQNAVDFRNRLLQLGFGESCILQNREGMNRVAALCYDQEVDARTELVKIRRQYPQFKDAWLLITQ